MKLLATLLLPLSILMAATAFGQTEQSDFEEVVYEGVYFGKNIYFQQSADAKGENFAIVSLFINHLEWTGEIKSPSFEVDLKALDIKVGSDVHIKILQHPELKYKFLNPDALGL